jgi:deoxyadenosine/deoxycytidine kinase/NTP pyrophosphatase (non-canonical NTP hydrolase)
VPRPTDVETSPDRFYIAIEGPIGVGKTTLARLVHEQLEAELLLEVFEENPFLSSFYTDRATYAFQTQIFFLLSRYRQQHDVIARVLQRSSLVSDYTFAKDELFARLNLSNDEIAVYERLHGVLAEKIPLPDLVVYLKADLDVLLERIAVRDRTYERAMSSEYMADLIQAYESFFASYNQTPVLTLDTNELNFVRNDQDLNYVLEHIRSALGMGTDQRPLTELETPARERGRAIIEGRRRRLSDLQSWRRAADQELGDRSDLYHDFITLQAQVGKLASELGQSWTTQDKLLAQVGNREEAQARALRERASDLKEQLAASLACLLRLANDLGINLEEAYLTSIRAACAETGDQGAG